jgi:para-nitrobenzyl esterase
MTMNPLLIAALGAALTTAAAAAEPVKVTTKSGIVVGEQDGAIRRFKGVPYARPPVGDLRWRAPQPIRWDGELKATEFRLPCLQNTPADGRPNGGGVAGPSAEDCLYLNVWAPANARNAPVMLWVYGGGGTMGAGSTRTYDGSAFARDGVVLVTINYRLGALAGFAHPAIAGAAPPQEAGANFHLLDTIAALRWVKDNARAFGGDPNNVTLFGESAGATITANLVTSPMAKGLFQKAIIQSTGSLPTPGTAVAAAEKTAADLATALGLAGADATAAQLRAQDAQKIISTPRLGGGLRTIIDGKVKTQSIMDAFAAGEAIDVPMIIGTNSDEGRLSGTQRVATFAMSGAPVWQYFFDYVPDWRRPEQPNGAPHAAEIPYVFDTLTADRTGGSRMTPKDLAVGSYIHSCWVAFAKQSARDRTIDCAGGFRWPARTEANGRATAIFQERPSLGKAPDLRSPPNGAPPGPTSRDAE